jgi:peptidoglycan/LPS O-acetylase OafA/YrhL
VYHAATFTDVTWGRAASPTRLGPWIQHLNVGVSVFFVLSGFLLFRPFVVAHLTDGPPPARGRYLVRRFARIFPAYWLALFLSARWNHLLLGDWWGQLRFYSLTQVYWGETALGGLAQAWSLCTELSFYLFLPLWAALLARVGGTTARRAGAHLVGLGGLYALGIGFRAQLVAGHHKVGYAWLPANTDLFAIGMAMAVLSAWWAVEGRSPQGLAATVGDLPWAAWLAAACCYAGVVSLHYPSGFDPPTTAQEVTRQVLFGLIAGLVVAPGVFGSQGVGLGRRILRSRPLYALGVVSYGVYLWHLTFMIQLDRPGSPIAPPTHLSMTVWGGAAAVLAATASWFALERPLLRLARRRRPAHAERVI